MLTLLRADKKEPRLPAAVAQIASRIEESASKLVAKQQQLGKR
jgi:hypothetical protein